MKYKVIALAVSSALLVACGSDNNNSVEAESYTTVQAFDGAVRYLDTFMTCGSEPEVFIGETGGEGKILIGEGNFPLFDEDPTQCDFSFREDPNFGSKEAIDESNSKPMPNVAYSVPGSLIVAGEPIAGTPFTTLIAKRLQEQPDTELDEIIDSVFEESFPAGTDLTDTQKSQLLSDPSTALASMDEQTSANVQASTIILSDALIAQPDKDSSDLTNVTKTLATTLAADPNFPVNEDGNPTYVDVSEELKDDTNFDDVVNTEPGDAEIPDDALVPGEELPPEEPEELPPATGGGGTTG
ncbi:hypothetical protein VIRA109638_13175 [Vibrio rarus]|uniref:hypothetical protein n=1 Tax=Vibrio rarus TaxID=413403 RepID=UPI0021C401E3|nr:hypothetical protein [Vibrio rarus]